MYRGCYFFLVHHLHLERCASPAVHVSPPPRGSITRCCTRATGSFSTPFASQTEIFGCFAIFSSQFARGEAKHLAKEPRVIAQIENDGATACACRFRGTSGCVVYNIPGVLWSHGLILGVLETSDNSVWAWCRRFSL